ncbi:hypothetical protein HBNXHr_0798 [Halorhabdus sp. BNX81]|nr:hypothetical protein HBNXHr_0798 [Halorhabdus sp. BNX81]
MRGRRIAGSLTGRGRRSRSRAAPVVRADGAIPQYTYVAAMYARSTIAMTGMRSRYEARRNHELASGHGRPL